MVKEYFDYQVVKPDQSEIEVKRGFYNVVGYLIWNTKTHIYEYKGKEPVAQEELQEILKSLIKLNKKSVLPKWLFWK